MDGRHPRQLGSLRAPLERLEVGTGSASGGGISNNDELSTWPSLAVTPSGTPYVAWENDSGGDAEIYVRRYLDLDWCTYLPTALRGS